ncbi:MAG: ABC transporter permease, partial [Bacillota bacterium]
GRTSLAVSVASNVLALLVGVPVGLIAGYYGRWADTCLMRLADIQLSVPTTLLAIAVVAVLGPSMVNLVIVLAITRWVLYARAVRASVLEIKEREFVEAAVAAGAPHLVVIKRHVLRNVMTPIIIITSQGIGFIILLEAALSFLGLGVQPPHPSWGEMIAAGRQYLNVAPWVVLAPGLALMITVLAVNFLGDGIRDLLDPRLRW